MRKTISFHLRLFDEPMGIGSSYWDTVADLKDVFAACAVRVQKPAKNKAGKICMLGQQYGFHVSAFPTVVECRAT